MTIRIKFRILLLYIITNHKLIITFTKMTQEYKTKKEYSVFPACPVGVLCGKKVKKSETINVIS